MNAMATPHRKTSIALLTGMTMPAFVAVVIALIMVVERLQQRTSRALEALRCANKAVSGRVDAEKLLSTDPAGTHNLLEHDTSLCAALSHAMKVGNHLRVLSGLHMANEPMLRSLQLIMSSSGEAQKPRRLFDASDASSRGHSAMRFPPTFAPLVQLLRESQEAAARRRLERGWCHQ